MKLQYYETNPLYISVGTLENEIIVSFNAKDEMQIGKLLFAKYPTLWKNDPKKTKEINERYFSFFQNQKLFDELTVSMLKVYLVFLF